MTTAVRALPTPASVASPGRRDATEAPWSGAGLQVVEGPHWSERIDCRPGIPQHVGDWWLWGLGLETFGFLAAEGNPLLLLLGNAGALATVIVGQLAMDEHRKNVRRASRRAAR